MTTFSDPEPSVTPLYSVLGLNQVLPMFSISFPPTQQKGPGSACRLPALVLSEVESSELSLTDAFVYLVNVYHVLSYVSGTALRLAPG